MGESKAFLDGITEREWIDLVGRAPITLTFPENFNCPICGDSLARTKLLAHWFPYTHVDVFKKCPTCNKEYLFGVPHSKDAGLALIIWDSNPQDAIAKFIDMGKKRCPWHERMVRTKIFGDVKGTEGTVRFQWKCPKCFYIIHERTERDFPHGEDDPYTEEEKDIFVERLRRLGYME